MADTLSLKEFIEQTLIEVCEAVESARDSYGYIAPPEFVTANSKEKASIIDFDVAITVSDSEANEVTSGSSIGGGMKIAVVKAETGIQDQKREAQDSSVSRVSRIKVSIPVYFQYDAEKRRKIEENPPVRRVVSRGRR
jgi:hypothetical protein